MATRVEAILDRTTRKGRVYYLVRWEGFTAENDTWESRVDLRQDGHFQHIQAFELKRKNEENDSEKDKTSSGGDKSPQTKNPRGRPRTSKSPARGRSRSVTKEQTTTRRARSTSRSSRKEKEETKVTTPLKSQAVDLVEVNNVTSEHNPQVFAEPTGSDLPHDGSQADDENDGNEVFNTHPVPVEVNNTVVADYVNTLANDGWLFQAFGVLLVVLTMLGHILTQSIEDDFPLSPEVKTLVLILTKTNSLPPLISLALVLWGKNNRISTLTRSLSKWIAICLVWRTAAEVILQLPDPKNIYMSISVVCVGIADISGLIAAWTSVGGSQPDYDVFTQTLCVFGFSLLILSDSLLYPVFESFVLHQSVRVLIMAMSTIFLSVSSILAEV